MSKPLISREDLRPCPMCGKGLMHNGLPLAWKITMHRLGIDVNAVRREQGLEMLMGGSVALARAFSPNSEFGLEIEKPITVMVCEPCALDDRIVIMCGFPDEKDEG
jgi:hypothetical protein